MIYVHHQINTVKDLKKIPLTNGVELDVRYHKNDLILHHDPFFHHENNPEKFEEILKVWQHTGPMILNIKTEGIEKACIDLMNKYGIKNWFFLDLSMPCFVVYANLSVKNKIKGFSSENLSVRFSEWEPIEYALAFSGKAKWVWVDCFSYLPMDKKTYESLKNAEYKICLVSPEIQNHPVKNIQTFKEQLKDIPVDAVCTKFPELWSKKEKRL